MNLSKKRYLRYNENYVPLPSYEGDEIFPNGIFNFNISRMMEYIHSGSLRAERERIEVKRWFTTHYRPTINEDHIKTVDVRKTVIQAEIRPGIYSIIDGNHRMEKAYRAGVPYMDSYKLQGEQLIPFFLEERGYKAFVDYWNSKLN
ncbi:ParB/RepB/Spo0J family partition protein [Bacillus piscicola]|uniref:ParB/RepB/Spo0J family partition protein n=1 Tax=Bacillus piscicola TaxID=1632684 RepID=UPI001F09BC06|nr:ParB/RepB/Spo0J family partition protein [Bacillus piscicola]